MLIMVMPEEFSDINPTNTDLYNKNRVSSFSSTPVYPERENDFKENNPITFNETPNQNTYNKGFGGNNVAKPSDTSLNNNLNLDSSNNNLNEDTSSGRSNGNTLVESAMDNVQIQRLFEYLQTNPTDFTCEGKDDGFYADVQFHCQAFHRCVNNMKYSFVCGPGTLFSQHLLTCDFNYHVQCNNETP
ncbi:hypothetical protein Anas_05147 [Armadillidium nasatum]|uniref:Chitin-binding type-2 domain-containing protein n=1 Tax=Armadillidium nasatum TaxID=96803 RepID=A0A5N5SR71_9CRUS|nr:hypothetical protein Anas_05147 [Armadillidium nasatum]